MKTVHVIGGGLAGCEAAWQLAERGVPVKLFEMRPHQSTGAHRTHHLAEVVCSNSFKSTLTETASGLLKSELAVLGCKLLTVASDSRVPAAHALAVDRDIFGHMVSQAIETHPKIQVERHRQDDLNLPLPAIIATGPLTATTLSEALREHCTGEHLYFYDAIAPSVDADTLAADCGYRASRYGKGDADYLNIPLDRTQYLRLIEGIRCAETVKPHSFEKQKYFEACLPIEEIVARGEDTLRFGPLKPRGLPDPRTGREPYAVIQLRQESRKGNLLGLVGFQTRMTYPAQKQVLRSIPGFENVSVLRFGSIHRNIFLDIPALCEPYQRDRALPGLFYAGQICGVEGYVECIASGLIAALAIHADLAGRAMSALPDDTMIGSLENYIHTPNKDFQPMNANMGILPVTGPRGGNRRARHLQSAKRALAAISEYRQQNTWLFSSITAIV
ncbi:MAG: methylenetetrahydrofolate--tRNA-(uracil(54)-C(5))-methyltransferase (FADH(2)-oxidizing) TrmFO [Candidatus Krumholzibacteria bacterium]|nr:methylenetetrahydrofolate--tRNA-(uracil(54)-C(5))-methyltransferase (FADH(2)-oxidizing) TrmFO [Candidatus Krumholzibacteria bacterium]